ncbi:MAG: ornithine carbamoyltransferase [Microthrixaceae bacterium]
MDVDLKGRSFLKELDLLPEELIHLLDLADDLKAAKRARAEQQHLVGRNIALVFEKTSTRTRAAFEVAAHDQGAHVTNFDPSGSQIGHKESVADTAGVLGRMFDAIQYRGSSQAAIERLAANAGVPVYNGLTDEWHPTQMLADFQTMRAISAKPANEISYAFLGDLRFNMARSHVVTAALLGADVRLAGPGSLSVPADVLDAAEAIAQRTGASITVTDDATAAVSGVDFVHTDVWVSMGEPRDVWSSRVKSLMPYRVDEKLMEAAGRQARFMHCLPAYHDLETEIGKEIAGHTGLTGGLEVTDGVFRSERSIVFDQAENRLHTTKALLVATLA